MLQRTSNYGSLSWIDALAARDKPKDLEAELASAVETPNENVLEETAAIAFGTTATNETKNEALVRASREIQAKEARRADDAEIAAIKARSKADPVALGIVSKETWEASRDPEQIKKIAAAAVVAQDKQAKHSFETVRPSEFLSSKFDPASFKAGKIMSSSSAMDDSAPRTNRVPSNASSILDPFKLDRFAAEETPHDKAVKERREAGKAREAEKKESMKFVDPGVEPMSGSQVIRSGSTVGDAFVQKVPRNQISMLDDVGTKDMTPAEIQAKLSALFEHKVPDSGEQIKKGNAERLEKIHPKRENDRSWEKVEKPVTTADVGKRLQELWLPPEPEKKPGA